jgi:hypothetical protein
MLIDFRLVKYVDQLGVEREYLRALTDEYEFTIEPHIVAGYDIGIYHRGGNIAIEKRATWGRQHPETPYPATLQQRMLERALQYANQLYDKYCRQDF